MKEEISLGELIVLVLQFVKKYFILFAVAIGIGIGIGYYKQSKVIPKHNSEAVICSDIHDGQRLKEIISEFEIATRTGNIQFLSQKLGISADSAANIESIKVELIKPEIAYRTDVDLTKVKTHNCIKVKCTAKRPSIYTLVQETLMKEFNEHIASKAIVDQRRKGYTETINNIVKDIEFLSDQRVKMFKQLENSNSKIDINQFDTEGQFIQAYEKKAMFEELLIRTKAAVLMKEFNTLTKATHSKLGGIIKMIVICLALAFAVAVFREIKV